VSAVPPPARMDVSAASRRYLASAARWAWFFAAMVFAYACFSLYSAARLRELWQLSAGMPWRYRLMPFYSLVPALGLALAQAGFTTAYARAAGAFASGREQGLAPAARALRHLWIVLLVTGVFAVGSATLVLLGVAGVRTSL